MIFVETSFSQHMKQKTSTKPTSLQILKLTARIAVMASLVNAFIFYLATLFGSLGPNVTAPDGAITGTIVVVATVVGAVFALFLYTIIKSVVKKPSGITRRVGYVLLLLSLLGTFGLEGANFGTPIFLSLMHIVVGVPLIEGYSNLMKKGK